MADAKKAANAVLRKYKIYKPTLDDLCTIVSDYGYDIIDFNPKSESIVALSTELALNNAIISQSAFAYNNGTIRLLFLQDSLSTQEKTYAVAHELGHIVLGHMQSMGHNSVLEEQSAYEFSTAILKPNWGLYIWNCHRRICIGVVCVALLICLFCAYMMQPHIAEAGELYITASGTKYHRANCSAIRGRPTVRLITQEEYESGAYLPCQLCLPDD